MLKIIKPKCWCLACWCANIWDEVRLMGKAGIWSETKWADELTFSSAAPDKKSEHLVGKKNHCGRGMNIIKTNVNLIVALLEKSLVYMKTYEVRPPYLLLWHWSSQWLISWQFKASLTCTLQRVAASCFPKIVFADSFVVTIIVLVSISETSSN